ncbi:collectin-11-like [Ornithodoros turicata]|uniref:collectin-11-like n=1 Tax=Ornithodoros turicata TaxID=34597 RepID=UPI003139182D
MELKVHGPTACLGACLQTENCRAFNYGASLCQLLDRDLCNETGLHLTENKHMSYYDLQPSVKYEHDGILFPTPYCREAGFCSPRCEEIIYEPYLGQPCEKNFECQMRAGPNSVCRIKPGLCKCAPGYYIEDNTTCVALPSSGYSLYTNLKGDGLYYKLSETSHNFTEALQVCEEVDGGFLARIDEGDVNRFLREVMRVAKVRNAYIGLTDVEQEGVWRWLNGDRLKTKQFWKPGAPDNHNDLEHCAQLGNEIDFGWDDVNCATVSKYLCQFPKGN